ALTRWCPPVVLGDGRPVLAVGGRGGRRLPNALFDVLTAYVGRRESPADAVTAPRLHTEGDLRLVLTGNWPPASVAHLDGIGYKIRRGPSATVHAVAFDPATGQSRAAAR